MSFFKKLFSGGKNESQQSNRQQSDAFTAKVLAAYNGTNPEMRGDIFPSAFENVEVLIRKIAICLYGEPENCSENVVGVCFTFYIQYWIRKMGSLDNSHLDDNVVAQRMADRFNEFDNEKVGAAISACKGYINEFIPSIKQRDLMVAQNKSLMKGIVGENAGKNEHIQELYLDDGDYGLVPDKPVFVAGFGEHNRYLSGLFTDKGEKIAYQRMGSRNEKGIAGPVDVYNTFLEDGKPYKTVYVSNYGSKTSTKAPAGFKLAGEVAQENSPAIDASSGMNMQKMEEVINRTFPGLTMYVRDVDLPGTITKKYVPGMIIREKAFVDASCRVGGMVTTHRYAILSNHMANMEQFEHGTNWGLFVAQRDSHFKVMAVHEYSGKTLILLLHLPDGDDWRMFQNVQVSIEEELISSSIERFERKCTLEAIPELTTDEWEKRCSFPIGMDDKGNLFETLTDKKESAI